MPEIKTEIAKDITGILDAPLLASDLASMIDSHLPYFHKLWKSARENELYVRGENLTEAQKKIYHDSERGHYPIPMIADKISRICSTQRNAKTSAKAEVADNFTGERAFPEAAMKNEIKAELYTIRFKHIEKDNNYEDIENETFFSGVGVKYATNEILVKYDAFGNPKIKIKKRDYLDTIWDSNAKEYDKSDGTFMGLVHKVYRMDIKKDYGEKIGNAISMR